MTLVRHRPTPTEHHYTRSGWIALGSTPILFAAGILISLAASGAGPGLGGALVGLLCLAAPTAALILGVAAAHAREPAARPLLMAGILAFAACAVLLPIAVISVNAWLIALAASAVVLALTAARLAR